MKRKRYLGVFLVATLVALFALCARLALAQGPIPVSSSPLAAPPQLAAITLNPIGDTYINAYQGGTNYGPASFLKIGGINLFPVGANTDMDRALLQFDLSGLPTGQIIESATLRLLQRQAFGESTNFIGAVPRAKPLGRGRGHLEQSASP
jgi:hypothetical protein